MADLTVGKKAPLFTLPSDGGQDISLSDYKGGKVILYLPEGQYFRVHAGSAGIPRQSGRV